MLVAMTACGTGDVTHDWLANAPETSQDENADSSSDTLSNVGHAGNGHDASYGHSGHR